MLPVLVALHNLDLSCSTDNVNRLFSFSKRRLILTMLRLNDTESKTLDHFLCNMIMTVIPEEFETRLQAVCNEMHFVLP